MSGDPQGKAGARRIAAGVGRPLAIELEIDGETALGYPGESVLAALVARGEQRMRDDRSGAPRGFFCNMGTCAECTVWVRVDAGPWLRRRACLFPVQAGLIVRTRAPEPERS